MPTMSDEELDRDWKPSGRRPQSTIARSFSLELMDIFRIENSVADLDEQVEKRKQHVSTKATELEALEARIREMEAMLKNPPVGRRAVSGGDQPSSSATDASGMPSPSSHRHARPSLNGVFPDASNSSQATPSDSSPSQSATPRPLEHRHRQAQHQNQQHQHAQDAQKYGGSRPGTARASQQAVPGALPPTPVGSEDGDTEHY